MRRRRDDVRERNGVVVALEDAARHEPGEVRHVDHEHGADFVRDLAQLREIDLPRVRAVSGEEDERLDLARLTADLVELEEHRLAIDGVRVCVEELARVVVAVAVREVTAGVVVEAEQALVVRRLADAIPVGARHLRRVLDAELLEHLRLDARGEDREVREEIRIRPRVRLHVGVLGAEEVTGELRRLALDVVDVLTPGVEPVRGIALSVLVGEERALRVLRRERAVVLARDELHIGALIAQLADDRRGDARRHGRDVIEHRVHRGGCRFGGAVPDAPQVLRQ